MRLNQFLAKHTDLSRRSADTAIADGKVTVNGNQPKPGLQISEDDIVTYNGQTVEHQTEIITILLHKPVGYVCSRNGQGSKTIYDLLPQEYHRLNPVGRLDKDSSGLLVMTNDGDLANKLTHPRYQKIKIYEIELNKSLLPLHQQMINDFGITLEDGISKLLLEKLDDTGKKLKVTMSEGRNRQIRRTFGSLGYDVIKLHRTNFGEYALSGSVGSYKAA